MMRRRSARKGVIASLCVSAFVGICSIAWAIVPRTLSAQHPASLPDLVQQQVDQHIPFAVVAGEKPGASCNPVELELVVMTDPQGRDLDYHWRIADENGATIECGDFYELYYRCDGHGCYRMRVVRRSESRDQEIISDPVHVCLR